MSVKVMTHVWELDLPSEQQQIMLALADHAHDDGSRCYPGVAYLAWKVGKSDSAVKRILGRLRDDGLIQAVRYLNGGRGHSTEYEIDLTKGCKKPPFVRSERVAPVDVKGGVSEERVAPVDVKGGVDATPTVINHQRTIKEPGRALRAAPRGLSDEDRSKLVTEYGPVLGDDAVSDHIADALAHTAVKKWTDTYRYVRNWLKREADRGGARANRAGPAGGNPPAESGRLLPFRAFGT